MARVYGDVSVHVADDFVATVELHRPPNNYFDLVLIRSLAEALESVDADPACRAVVLCSQGKHFCAGANFGDGEFGTDRAADGWLASRSVVGTGPLPTTADGPACRTVREDEILARLLRDPGSGTLRALASENTWTSHLRAELFGALRRRRDGAIPDATAVRLQYQHSLERAPGWALREIGWPHAHRAMRYLDRLLATEVTEGQAVAAAQALTAAGPAPALTVTGIPAPQARAPHPAGRSRDLSAAVPLARAATARRIILQPPALPSSDGLIPRR